MIDTKQTGGRNPLVDAAQQISLTGPPPGDPDDPRGEQTGYVEHEPGQSWKIPGADGIPAAPEGGSKDSAVIASGPEPPVGSLEGFMKLFGDGGTPGPKQR